MEFLEFAYFHKAQIFWPNIACGELLRELLEMYAKALEGEKKRPTSAHHKKKSQMDLGSIDEILSREEHDLDLSSLWVLENVNQVGTGFSFGEMALLNSKPRNATVQCAQNTVFASLDKEDYK
mmetsp:Transcript_23704/g.23398  ORF Transcript_23704/g.23398 Transcript_23704/m.23398 type:complete len:123 (-) Transcript_23704:148-516(-)